VDKKGRKSPNWPRSLGDLSRTRRARLVAEFEAELGVDHIARIKAFERARRWKIIKTVIVWTIALVFFAIAIHKLWLMGQAVDKPFSNINPIGDLRGQ
jgi:hypothetical protein